MRNLRGLLRTWSSHGVRVRATPDALTAFGLPNIPAARRRPDAPWTVARDRD
jgi:hypothetical protein